MKLKSLISIAIVAWVSLSSCEKALDRSYKRATDEAGEEKEKQAKAGAGQWYSSWINTDEGQNFHTELSLKPSEVVHLEIPSSVAQKIGLVVEKGYDISKEKTYIYMGTDEEPKSLGTSTGSSKVFDPIEGTIKLRFENSSSISTKVAVYTQAK